jgi:hypothetical protein
MYFVYDKGELWVLKQQIFRDFHWTLTLQPEFDFFTLKYEFLQNKCNSYTACVCVCVCVCVCARARARACVCVNNKTDTRCTVTICVPLL